MRIEIVSPNADKKNERLSRTESYVKNTHQSFLNSLKMAEQMQILGNGALAGKVKHDRRI